MKIIYILNGLGFSRGMPIGGADKRALEIGRSLLNEGNEITFLTTDAGEEVLEKWGGAGFSFITVKRPFFWPKFLENNLIGRVISYVYVIISDIFTICSMPATTGQIIYPTSDMFFDLLPAALIKFRNSHSKTAGIIHHWVRSPKERGGDFIPNLLLFFSQQTGFFILKLTADLVFYPKTDEGLMIKKSLLSFGFPENKLFEFQNGINIAEIEKIPDQEKIYEAVFLGSLRPSKGIFDLVSVWQSVLKEFPKARLLVIGGGADEYTARLKEGIEEAGLQEKIILAGVVPQDELYKKIKSAKVMIAPSYEEGWGISVGEAIACGLPVVAYDLPAYNRYGKALILIPIGDKEIFSEKIINLIKENIQNISKDDEIKNLIKDLDWSKSAAIEGAHLMSLIQ